MRRATVIVGVLLVAGNLGAGAANDWPDVGKAPVWEEPPGPHAKPLPEALAKPATDAIPAHESTPFALVSQTPSFGELMQTPNQRRIRLGLPLDTPVETLERIEATLRFAPSDAARRTLVQTARLALGASTAIDLPLSATTTFPASTAR